MSEIVCKKCSNKIAAGSLFCNFCGARQNEPHILSLNEQIAQIEEVLSITNSVFSDKGRLDCEKWINEFGFDLVFESAKISLSQYLRYDENNKPNKNSVISVFNKIGGICRNKKLEKEKPYITDVRKLINYAKKKFNINYYDEQDLNESLNKLLFLYYKGNKYEERFEELFVELRGAKEKQDYIVYLQGLAENCKSE